MFSIGFIGIIYTLGVFEGKRAGVVAGPSRVMVLDWVGFMLGTERSSGQGTG
jgi:hypothetical protein